MSYQGLKYLVVGAGWWGAVIAEQIASVLKEKVVVIDKRSHIGGNCFSRIHPEAQVECHEYGTHIFHTVHEKVWNYFTRFADLNQYQHKVLTQHKNRVYPMPISLATINAFYGLNLKPGEVEAFLKGEIARSGPVSVPANLEEKAISLIGRPLYEAFIKGYTHKQWEMDPRLLPAEIITRLPVRHDYNANYFNAPHQGLPREGYFKLFEKVLAHPNIEVRLNTNFFDIKDQVPEGCRVVFTGPIDRLFEYKFGALQWRSLRFELEVVPTPDYQGTAVMNYADLDIPYTRIHEFKHLHPERHSASGKTVICREYSMAYDGKEDPYYPINDPKNTALFALYAEEAKKKPHWIIGGRLGAYRYWDMDQAILNALETFSAEILRGAGK